METFRHLSERFVMETTGVEESGSSGAAETVWRVYLETPQEAETFIKVYGEYEHTNYIVSDQKIDPKRYIMSKTWICQHSKKNKTTTSERNADCKVTVTILMKIVNRNTKKNDIFLKRNPPLNSVVTIKNIPHSHNLLSADNFRMLRVSPETKEVFQKYFKSGMGASEAKHLHEDRLMLQEKYVQIMADASKNPTNRQVRHLYNLWRTANMGSIQDPLTKLIEKSEEYNQNGNLVAIHKEEPWAVMIVTPTMMRTQKLKNARDIIFLDSTTTCEQGRSTVTVMLTASAVGALPTAVFLHERQTILNYQTAFELFKANCKFGFGNKECPELFMTDDSIAEKEALKEVWPRAKQLLCHFHVAQAEWRWLHSSKEVQMEEKLSYMKLFQKVIYSETDDQEEAAVSSIKNIAERCPKFVQRFEKFYERREEWVLKYRNGMTVRNHNTNNFSEATVRILKEVILKRTQAYNIVALSEFIINIFENYIIKKILKYAYNRERKPIILYKKLSQQVQLDSTIGFLSSDTCRVGGEIVNTEVGVCTCSFGISGAFCKHQLLLYIKKKIKLPNFPLVTATERYNMAKIALGDECPDIMFFKEFTDLNLNSEDMELQTNNPAQESRISTKDIERPCSSSRLREDRIEDTEEALEKQLDGLYEQLKKRKGTLNLKELYKLRIQQFQALLRSGKTRKIKVQPTSISRRKIGQYRGTGRIAAGRPPKV